MQIDADLLIHYLDELAACGAEPAGGCYRPLYSAPWAEACGKVERWIVQAGMAPRRDAVGNLWGRLDGTDSGRSITAGSHIDTVRGGGRLDGALGVIAAVLAVRALSESYGRPKRPIEVLVTCEEEGSRFATNFWGARAIVGGIAAGEAEAVTDAQGVSLARAMAEHGLDAAVIGAAMRDDLDAFLELHIEQGGVLEASHKSLGVVTSIVGGVNLRVSVVGRSDHAGTTAMTMRRDALAGAAEMVHAVERIALEMGPPAVATVGTLEVEPSQTNVVPQSVTFAIDLRHGEPDLLARLMESVRTTCHGIAASRTLGIEFRTIHERQPLLMDREIASQLQRAAGAEDGEAINMVSGAGHDAQILARRCRAGMLFVPSIGGRSHCPEEATETADLVLGTRVLGRALYYLAYE